MLFFRNAFIELDLELKKEHLRFTYNGSTCTASIITPTQIFIANLGDSRTILIRKPSGEDGDVPRKGRARRNSVKLGCEQHMGPTLYAHKIVLPACNPHLKLLLHPKLSSQQMIIVHLKNMKLKGSKQLVVELKLGVLPEI